MVPFIFYVVCLTFIAVQDTTAILCPENEMWFRCAGRGCEHSCKDPTGPIACNLACIPGCNCKKGYFRDSRGRCVLGEDCDNCRGDVNAFIAGCGDPCPATCDNPRPIICPRICKINGCKCRKGYVLGPEGKCIRPQQCKRCGKNEYYDPCAQCDRDRTCRQFLAGIQQICPARNFCKGRCRCLKGYYRNCKGECVHRSRC